MTGPGFAVGRAVQEENNPALHCELWCSSGVFHALTESQTHVRDAIQIELAFPT